VSRQYQDGEGALLNMTNEEVGMTAVQPRTHRSLGSRMRPVASPPSWAPWAVPQLDEAAALVRRLTDERSNPSIAAELYREWFNPVIEPAGPMGVRRPAAGLYRAAHAGSRSRVLTDGVWVVERNDIVGRDGWWRTWNDAWLPTRSRAGALRVLFSPQATPEALGTFVGTVTAHLGDLRLPWLLACATDPRRLRRHAGAVLYLPGRDELPAGVLELVDAVRPVLASGTPPLCLRLADGAAVAEYPTNGMSFGEHRCHLVALALTTRSARRAPLLAIADVFAAHGIDPAAPHRSASRRRRGK
jgi:hypothetical protein